ncbi:hypothetical protein O3M35_011468 [Rhynocoris fuscipes]|uniref:Uncharacterized protein n=1 Tax=Rhynocoris fuscipes TaxID=488301 RepID=A0AAW1D0U9_9HEMI
MLVSILVGLVRFPSRRSIDMSLLLYFLALFITLVASDEYIDKEILAKYEIQVFKPKGFRISVPHTDGITLFAVHLNVNKEMQYLEAGQIAVDVVKRKGERWVYENNNIRIRPGDKLYFWLYVIADGLGHRLDDQVYTVSGDLPPKKPEESTTSASPTVRPTVRPTGTRPTVKPTECELSDTSVSGKEVCKGDVILHEQFDTRPGWSLFSNWTSEIELPGSDSRETFFVVYDSTNAAVEKGFLSIKPTLIQDNFDYDFVRNGELRLKGCTADTKERCEATGTFWKIIPPVLSSRITTKNSFSFKYGKIEIRAKLPKGDWIVPEIWLVGKNYGPHAGRLTIAKSLGNEDLKSDNRLIGGQLLRQGVSINDHSPKMFSIGRNSLWSDAFHLYQVDWAPDSIKFKVDGTEVGSIYNNYKLYENIVDGSNLAPFDTEFYISLGIHVGGLSDFPDDSVNRGQPKPWADQEIKNMVKFWQAKDKWYSTWGEHSKLLIDYIKITAI